MEKEHEQGYWIWTEDGYRFCPVIDDMPRSPEAFWRAWVRMSCLIFIMCPTLSTSISMAAAKH